MSPCYRLFPRRGSRGALISAVVQQPRAQQRASIPPPRRSSVATHPKGRPRTALIARPVPRTQQQRNPMAPCPPRRASAPPPRLSFTAPVGAGRRSSRPSAVSSVAAGRAYSSPPLVCGDVPPPPFVPPRWSARGADLRGRPAAAFAAAGLHSSSPPLVRSDIPARPSTYGADLRVRSEASAATSPRGPVSATAGVRSPSLSLVRCACRRWELRDNRRRHPGFRLWHRATLTSRRRLYALTSPLGRPRGALISKVSSGGGCPPPLPAARLQQHTPRAIRAGRLSPRPSHCLGAPSSPRPVCGEVPRIRCAGR